MLPREALISLVGLFVFYATDHRFGWSPVPPVVTLVGDILAAGAWKPGQAG